MSLLKSSFVCVGLAHNGRGALKDTEGEFCRKIIDQSPTGNLQGLYVVNTAGVLVGHIYDFDPKGIKRMLEKVLREFKPVEAPPIEGLRKDRKFDVPEGALVVDVFTKVLGGYGPLKNKEGSLRYDMEKAWQNGLGRDHLWVRKDEQAALANGVLPESLKKRLARFHLVDDTRGTPLWWKEAEIKKIEMTLEKGRLTGSAHFESAEGDRGFQTELLGFIETKEGKVTRFDVVAKGQFWGKAIYSDRSTPEGGGPKGKYPLAVTFSLADVNDPLYRLQPDVLRGSSEYLR